MKTIVVLLLFMLWATAANANTYWMSTSSNGANGCVNSASPLTTTAESTLKHALSCLSAGDTLYIRAGTYTNQPSVANDSGGNNMWTPPTATAGAPTTISRWTGDGGAVILRFVSLGGGDNAAIHMQGGDYVTFSGGGLADGLQFDGSNQSSSVESGAFFVQSNHVTFDRVRINGWGGQGIGSGISSGGNSLHVSNSKFDGNGSNCVGHYPPEEGCHGIYVGGGNDIIIESSEFSSTRHGSGVQIYCYAATPCNNIIIRKNFFHDNILGIYGGASTGGLIENNIITKSVDTDSRTVSYGILAGYDESGSGWPTYRNNTIYGNANGCIANVNSVAVKYYNNICYGNTGAGNTISGSGYTASNNVFTNPVFANASGTFNLATDFRLNAASGPAYNTGLNAQCPSTDYAGTTRPQNGTCEAGAFEFSGVGPVVTITGPSSNPTYFTNNSTVTLSGTSVQTGGTVSYVNDRGGSGSTITVANWSFPGVILNAGLNNITVTATDAATNTSTDQIAITYAPTFPGNALELAFGFEEGAGTTATDQTGQNNGTLFNGATRVDAARGQGVHLNGTNQYVNVPSDNTLDFTQSFTFSLWLKPTNPLTGYQAAIVKNYMIALYASQNGDYCANNGPMIWFQINGGVGSPSSYAACYPTALQAGNWTHLAGTYDNAAQQLKLYVNGVLQVTTPASGYIEPSTGTAMIGNSSQTSEYLDGDVDEVRMYNYALPLAGTLNTTAGVACQNASEAVSAPSIIGDMNCPVNPLQPPIAFKVSASSTLKLGATGGGVSIGQVPP